PPPIRIFWTRPLPVRLPTPLHLSQVDGAALHLPPPLLVVPLHLPPVSFVPRHLSPPRHTSPAFLVPPPIHLAPASLGPVRVTRARPRPGRLSFLSRLAPRRPLFLTLRLFRRRPHGVTSSM